MSAELDDQSRQQWMAGACAALGIDPQTSHDELMARISLLRDLRTAAASITSGRRIEDATRHMIERAGELGGLGAHDTEVLLKHLRSIDELLMALRISARPAHFAADDAKAFGGPPNGYESTTPAYIRYVSPEKFAKFSAEVQSWYRPYWVSEAAKAAACPAAVPAFAKARKFTPPASCDSSELCLANRGCAGQFGSQQRCDGAGADPLAATPADMLVYDGIADGYARDLARSQGRATAWPKARDIARVDDMSGEGYLRLVLDGDNDVIVEVFDESRKRFAAVEFCNPGACGGGQSRHTRNALIAVMVAMESDNRENTKKAHPRFGAPQTKDTE